MQIPVNLSGTTTEQWISEGIRKQKAKLELVSEVIFDLNKCQGLFAISQTCRPEEILCQLAAELPSKFEKNGISIRTSSVEPSKFNIKAYLLESIIEKPELTLKEITLRHI